MTGQEVGAVPEENKKRHTKKRDRLEKPKPEQMAETEPVKKRRYSGVLRRRWMTNTLLATFAIVAVAVLVFSMSMRNYYVSTVQATLESRAQTVAGMFQDYTESTYRSAARQFVNQFEEKNTMEVQFLTPGGRVLMSSLLNISGSSPGSPDIEGALASRELTTRSYQDASTGDHLMASSAPVIYNGNVVGLVRMVTSMRLIDRQVINLVLLASCVGLGIMVIMSLYASSFIRTIVDPVSRVTETARRIAAGSYGVQMERTSDDEIGELIDTINDMSVKIDQAERTQSEFISSVSHELRTPLTAISGWAETLYNGEIDNAEDMKKGLGIVVSEAKRLTNMVEELLEFSRIETGRFNLSVEPVDIKAELEDAAYTYREFFRRKGLELRYTECEEEFAPIDGDPERLRQVFCNLLDNADKHGGAGGVVDLSISGEPEYVVIRIRDYGPGVPEEELPFVKYKFYKGSSKVRGSGIGLAVCDEIVACHGGSLDIGNAEGGGCVVTLRLPKKISS
ncbi:MAG: HAMP domain-containing sensor histidine kinase [Oscillospiraceae bacterium]|nr:HAMP domain-containing sensor histidine kinase [Oscillospiraceae bacterium]